MVQEWDSSETIRECVVDADEEERGRERCCVELEGCIPKVDPIGPDQLAERSLSKDTELGSEITSRPLLGNRGGTERVGGCPENKLLFKTSVTQ
jgi:hypothetical protein